MKKIQSLLSGYEAEYVKDIVFPELEISLTNGNPGLVIRLTGMFPEHDLDQSTITNFDITGVQFDFITIEKEEEDFMFDLVRAVMAGEYTYVIQTKSFGKTSRRGCLCHYWKR